MLSLFFKKNFYDGWDNVMFFFVPNLLIDALIILCTGIASLGVTVFKDANFFLYIWILLALVLVCGSSIFTLAWAESSKGIADYESVEFKDFFKSLKGCVKDGIKYGITLAAVITIAVVGGIYFLKPQGGQVSFAGFLAGVCYIWAALIIVASLFWYPALRAYMHNPFLKTVKKCFIVFFDNLLVSIVLGFYNLFLSAVSVIMLGIAPGMCGLQLARANAFRLIMKKYDYIEELDKNGEPFNSKARRKIPWKELLKDDIEANPTRGFKAFIFPWKENQ